MRAYIARILERGPGTAADLARELQVTLPEVLDALAAMERLGEVVGQAGYYTLVPERPELRPNVIITAEVEAKILAKHDVRPQEVYQALADPGLRSVSVEARGRNPVVRAVGRTAGGRLLRLILVLFPDGKQALVTALDASKKDIRDVHYR